MIANIVSYNLLTPLRQLVADVQTMDGVDGVTIIDHESTYPPLLEWYEHCGCKIIHGTNDRGGKGAFRHIDARDWYLFTDSDLDISTVPKDAFVRLRDVLRRNQGIVKAGLSLEINDLPDAPLSNAVRDWEKKYWTKRFDRDYWSADVDTTIAVYRPGAGWGGYGPALRADRPYTCRHTPWYWDLDHLTKEQEFYLSQTIRGTWWTGRAKRQLKFDGRNKKK